ncbi:BSD domain-containing protein 1 [Entophlyctis luteolus]|nr:BSD domain-containing protein 1 [Entophlyctis luteolus]
MSVALIVATMGMATTVLEGKTTEEANTPLEEEEDSSETYCASCSAAPDIIGLLLVMEPSIDDDRHHGGKVTDSSDANASTSAAPVASFGGWGWTTAMPSLSWNSIVDTVKKQTDVVANVLERDITEFITIVAPSNADTANDSSTSVEGPSESLVIDPETGIVVSDGGYGASSAGETVLATVPAEAFTRSSDDPLTTPTVAAAVDHASVVTDTVARLEALVDRAEGLIDSGVGSVAKMVERVDVAHTVERIENLADRAEDFLESVETGMWNFMSSAISNATSLIPTDLGMRSGSSGTAKGMKSNIIFDRKTATIISLRHSESTYLEDPANIHSSSPFAKLEQAKRYVVFKDAFEISLYSTEIARLFDDDIEMRGILTKLVPSSLTYDEFWLRYFFQISEVEREEEARKKLMNDAEQNAEEFDWDNDSSEEENLSSGAQQRQGASSSPRTSRPVNEPEQHQPTPVRKPAMLNPLVPVSITEAVAVVEQNRGMDSPIAPAMLESLVLATVGEDAKHKSPALSEQSSFDVVSDDKRVESMSEEGTASDAGRRDAATIRHVGDKESGMDQLEGVDDGLDWGWD